MTICRKCKEQLVEGDYTRAEPVSPGSHHYAFYHYACYQQVKEERQRQKEPPPFPDYPER